MTVDQAGAVVNILRPTDAYKRQLIETKFVQVMVCRRTDD